ncbi:myb domain-containing protein [Heterostelium album PN500]|uniref:Myb domain-containing protein n=1 Tax=Heterostelium pallidum (strain ATCC 26659 / Pp 5 / PN500) TaxID=670386 RepID=D3BQI0_HETP5|nr:myb domain-containing protein [Heterostelium album PN500]EFA76400.1 myb domain-containing protein [Heterostelium album PN500]|eukprot:XP_020428532.1 myb domain-containing protein [Heterostelium album PN500]
MDYTAELSRINKDEEFEYFNLSRVGKNLGPFKAWSMDEHTLFHSVLANMSDPNDIDTVASAVPSRTKEQVEVHLRVYKNYCNKQTSTTLQSNPFMSNLTTNLFKGVLDSLSGDPLTSTSPTTLGASSPLPSPSLSSSPPLTPTIPSSPSKQQASTGTGTTGTTPTGTPTSSGKISLHLASHAIPTSLQPKMAPAASAAATTTPPAAATPVSSAVDDSSGGAPKSKKDLKILSEPWSLDDQKRLDDALTKYPSTRYSSVSRWQAISKELGISPKTVALRYNQMLESLIPKKPNVAVNNNNNNNIDVGDVDDGTGSGAKGKRKSTATAKTAAKQAATKKGKKDTPEKSGGLPPFPITPPSTAASSASYNKSNSNQQQYQQQQQQQQQKREPTIHNLNFDPSKADQLIQRNTSLIDQIRSDIIYTGSTKIDLLEQYKNNISEALKSTMIWAPESNEMPPLPVKVNDMIITMMGSMPSKSTLKHWSPLPKTAEEWNLTIPEDQSQQQQQQQQPNTLKKKKKKENIIKK